MVRKVLRTIGVLLAAALVLLVAAMLLLSTDWAQNKLMQRAVGMLRVYLQTEVRMGHISVDFLRGRLKLCDVEIDDRQGRRMFRMEGLGLGLDVRALMKHFTVKKHMMKQLRALGNISYRGGFDVLFKRQVFAGRLGTEAGAIGVNFTLDGLNKYIYGSACTDSLHLGHVMDMKHLGAIRCGARFRFDISKQRTAMMRRKKGGKLPIGSVEAQIGSVRWMFGTRHNIDVRIESNGGRSHRKSL